MLGLAVRSSKIYLLWYQLSATATTRPKVTGWKKGNHDAPSTGKIDGLTVEGRRNIAPTGESPQPRHDTVCLTKRDLWRPEIRRFIHTTGSYRHRVRARCHCWASLCTPLLSAHTRCSAVPRLFLSAIISCIAAITLLHGKGSSGCGTPRASPACYSCLRPTCVASVKRLPFTFHGQHSFPFS